MIAGEVFAWFLALIMAVSALLNWLEASKGGRLRYTHPVVLRWSAIFSLFFAFCIIFYFTSVGVR